MDRVEIIRPARAALTQGRGGSVSVRELVILVNPAAARGKGRSAFHRQLPELEKRFDKVTFTVTQSPADLAQGVVKAAKEGIQTIAVAGGDGTTHVAANALLSSGLAKSCRLAVLPAGTGNSFLREWNLHDVSQVLDAIANMRSRLVDVLRIVYWPFNGAEPVERYAVNNLHTGFFARVGEIANSWLKVFGARGYDLAVFTALLGMAPRRMDVEADGQAYRFSTAMMTVANTQYTGGAMHISPASQADDGYCELLAFDGVSWPFVIRHFKKVYAGTHVQLPQVKSLVAAHFTLAGDRPIPLLIDGESGFRAKRVSISIEPRALIVAC